MQKEPGRAESAHRAEATARVAISRVVLALLVVTLIVPVEQRVVAAPMGQEGAERLANGGFEEGLAGWERPSWFAAVVGAHGGTVRSGAQALRFSGRASGPHV